MRLKEPHPMGTAPRSTKTPPERLEYIREIAESARHGLIEQRRALRADLPLRFWNQQAHFTTPASGTPEKAIRGLAPVGGLLEKFGLTAESIAEHSGASLEILKGLIDGADKHSPFVMVDVEDAVALNPETIRKARD